MLAGAHLLDAPRHGRRREVVQEHPVGGCSCKPQHLGVERAQYKSWPSVVQTHTQAGRSQGVVGALVTNLVASDQGTGHGHPVACLGERGIAVGGPVPPVHHHRRGNPDAQADLPVRMQRLQGGGPLHRQKWSPKLEGQHAGSQPEPRCRCTCGGQGGEGLGAGGLRCPEAVEPQFLRPPGGFEPGVHAQRLERGERDAGSGPPTVGAGGGVMVDACGHGRTVPGDRSVGCWSRSDSRIDCRT